MSLHPSVAAVRFAVRRGLRDVPGGAPVLVACSGGADSLALLAATVHEARSGGWRVVGVTVDHGMQDGSAEHAADVVARMAALGVHETASARVVVDPGGRGVEAAAREARYAVLDQLAAHFASSVVLLGHTRDDQAETVLLGLARGSGGRSLAGMRRTFEHYRRPLLDVPRADTVTACQVEGLTYWNDPQNLDPAFTRVRVRRRVLPVLEDELGPGVAATLARTADQLREDTAFLDDVARAAYADARDAGWALAELSALAPAVLGRVLRLAALEAGAIDAELFWVHVQALQDLVRGVVRGEIQLPGHLTAHLTGQVAGRDGAHLGFRATAVEP